MNIGVTGHQKLTKQELWTTARKEMEAVLRGLPTPFVGFSSLAIGADQIFGELVLELGQSLVTIVPFETYAEKFDNSSRIKYMELLSKSSRIEILQEGVTDEEAYFAAGKIIVERSDLMIAVWDGEPAAGFGGTADIVDYAKLVGKRTYLINPYKLGNK